MSKKSSCPITKFNIAEAQKLHKQTVAKLALARQTFSWLSEYQNTKSPQHSI